MAVFPALGWKFGIGGELIMWLILAVILLISGLIDWQAKLLPDGLLLGAVVNRVIFLFLLAQPLKETLLHMAAGAISVSLPLLLLTLLMDHLLGRETMGGGDIKLLFVLGLYMDWMEMVLILLIGCVLALIRGLWQKRKSLQDSIAFGPFLAAGWLLVLFGGAPLIDWYCALLI
jgi:leader peptidase (prepilin peptidase)/N-methyltransferase